MDRQRLKDHLATASADVVAGWYWGAEVLRYVLDLSGHSFEVDVEMRRDGIRSQHRLQFRGISLWSFYDQSFHRQDWSKAPWNYVSIESIETSRIVRADTAVWKINAELWSASLEIHCLEFTVEALSVVDDNQESHPEAEPPGN